jgi:hypothetical protein
MAVAVSTPALLRVSRGAVAKVVETKVNDTSFLERSPEGTTNALQRLPLVGENVSGSDTPYLGELLQR